MKQLCDPRFYAEVEKVFQIQVQEIYSKVDCGFAYLMGFQWLACTFMGILSGSQTSALIGLVFGGLFAAPTIYYSKHRQGRKVTRYFAALGQAFFSILIVYLSGGSIESHFHIFVSVAALAFYMDPTVLWLASSVTFADHIVRGIFLPMSLYGQAVGVEWRWVEHMGWLVFANLILIVGIRRIRHGLLEMAHSKVQLMHAREDALRLSSAKSSFLSNMSHEIRTPLNSIMGFSDILRDTPLSDEQKEYVCTIHRCSETLLRLINDILDFSKIESGLMQVDRHRFDLKELHDDIHKMFSAKCIEKGLILELNMSEDIPSHAVGDSHRLRQILMNLVGNAVKFTEKGKIRIEVEKDSLKKAFVWRVVDTGKGIQCENLKKLFRSFYQEDPSIARKYGGTGLGLVISKNLIEMMGGKISVDSKVGEGTTFSFSLPLEESET